MNTDEAKSVGTQTTESYPQLSNEPDAQSSTQLQLPAGTQTHEPEVESSIQLQASAGTQTHELEAGQQERRVSAPGSHGFIERNEFGFQVIHFSDEEEETERAGDVAECPESGTADRVGTDPRGEEQSGREPSGFVSWGTAPESPETEALPDGDTHGWNDVSPDITHAQDWGAPQQSDDHQSWDAPQQSGDYQSWGAPQPLGAEEESDDDELPQQSLPEVRRVLKNLVKCPICLQTPSKVLMCENGHQICEKCFDRLEPQHVFDEYDDLVEVGSIKCPIGLCLYQQPTPIRNRAMEELIETFNFKVSCRHDGCHYSAKSQQIQLHEEHECTRRPVKCPRPKTCLSGADYCMGPCGIPIPLEELPTHMITLHGSKVQQYENDQPEMEMKECFPTPTALTKLSETVNQFKVDNLVFYFTMVRRSPMWNFVASVNAGKKVADKYVAMLKIRQQNSPMRVESVVQVQPVSQGFLDAYQVNGQCLSVNFGHIKSLLSECEKRSECTGEGKHMLVYAIQICKKD